MKQLDLTLFAWMAAGHEPNAWILSVAALIAVWGPWIGAVLVAWAFARQPAQRGYLVATLCALAVAALLAHWIASALGFPRPFMTGLSPPYVPHGARGSLPSAHASVMFTLALALLVRPGLRRIGLLATVAACATGWARIYVGIHFPLDIAAGVLLAMAIVSILSAIFIIGRHLAAVADRRRIPAFAPPKAADKSAS